MGKEKEEEEGGREGEERQRLGGERRPVGRRRAEGKWNLVEGKMETIFFMRNTSEKNKNKNMHFPKRTLTLGVKADCQKSKDRLAFCLKRVLSGGKDAEEALTASLRVGAHPLSGVG